MAGAIITGQSHDRSAGLKVTSAAHGLAAGDVVRFDGAGWVAAASVSLATAPTHVVSLVPSVNELHLVSEGVSSGFSGLVAGSLYFCTAGAVSLAASTFESPVGVALSATEMYVKIAAPRSAGSDTTSQNDGVNVDLAMTVIDFSSGMYASGGAGTTTIRGWKLSDPDADTFVQVDTGDLVDADAISLTSNGSITSTFATTFGVADGAGDVVMNVTPTVTTFNSAGAANVIAFNVLDNAPAGGTFTVQDTTGADYIDIVSTNGSESLALSAVGNLRSNLGLASNSQFFDQGAGAFSVSTDDGQELVRVTDGATTINFTAGSENAITAQLIDNTAAAFDIEQNAGPTLLRARTTNGDEAILIDATLSESVHFQLPIYEKSAAFVAKSGATYLVDASAGAVVVTLPSEEAGRWVRIIPIDVTNDITVNEDGGSAVATLNVEGVGVQLFSSATAWHGSSWGLFQTLN